MVRRDVMEDSRRSLNRRAFLRGLSVAAGACLIELPTVRLAAAQGTMKLGTLIPLTGPLAEFGPNFRKAADLAAGHFKEAGLSLQLIHADDETAAIPAVAAARKLVNVDRVPAVIGAAASGVTIPVAESVTLPNKVVQITNASTSPLITVLPADQGQDFLFGPVPPMPYRELCSPNWPWSCSTSRPPPST